MAQKIAVGIDIGTYQVKVVVAGFPRGGSGSMPRIMGVGFAESKGLRHGYIVNAHETTKSIGLAIEQAEAASGIKIRRAYVSVGGAGLDEITGRGEVVIGRADYEVSDLDVEKTLAAAEQKVKSKLVNRKVLHAIPLTYTLDGSPVLGKPQGMKGTKLETDVLFITCLEQHLNDIISCVEEAGVSVEDVIAAPLSASLVILSKADKKAGCVLANIGSETVSIAVFENGLPVSVKVFPLGSADITNDIALGLKVSLSEAEQIKVGSVIGASYPRKKLDDIVASRLADIFRLIEVHLKKIGRSGLLPAGIIITGGGSGMATIEDLAKAVLKLPSRLYLPAFRINSKIKDASWAVAYGLTISGLTNEEEKNVPLTGGSLLKSVWRSLSQFLP